MSMVDDKLKFLAEVEEKHATHRRVERSTAPTRRRKVSSLAAAALVSGLFAIPTVLASAAPASATCYTGPRFLPEDQTYQCGLGWWHWDYQRRTQTGNKVCYHFTGYAFVCSMTSQNTLPPTAVCKSFY